MANKYSKITDYLNASNFEKITLTYDEIGKIIEGKLPDFVYKYPHRFFYNNESNGYYKYWNNSGYDAEVNHKGEKVTFMKVGESKKAEITTQAQDKKVYEKKRNKPIRAKINRPSISEVEFYLKRWDSLENYVLQESSIDKLFNSLAINNVDIESVLLKASVLNDFYSTNIFSIFDVAKRILNLNIDDRLSQGDLSLVNDIANVVIKGKEKNFYSFASKYCSHHNPLMFPIYDSYVDKILIHFRDTDGFADFDKSCLKDYKRFVGILNDFRLFYDISQYNLKEIDKYLWQLGKLYYPNKYYSKKKSQNRDES